MAIKRLPSTGDRPRATGVPDSLVPGGSGDSAGFPWAGRSFDHHGVEFADDDGAAPAEWLAAASGVRAAAETFRASSGSEAARDELAGAHVRAIAALNRCRLLIPLLAEAGDLGVTPEGRTVEKTQELSIVTVAAPDGRRVMPAFSSVAAMRAWNPESRPIPVPGPQVALAAAQEGTDLIIIDPGTPATEFGVRRTQLEPMAVGRATVPAWADPEVGAAFAASIQAEPRIHAIALEPGDPEGRLHGAELVVMLLVEPGLEREALQSLVAEVQSHWATSAVIAERVDSVRVSLHAMDGPEVGRSAR